MNTGLSQGPNNIVLVPLTNSVKYSFTPLTNSIIGKWPKTFKDPVAEKWPSTFWDSALRKNFYEVCFKTVVKLFCSEAFAFGKWSRTFIDLLKSGQALVETLLLERTFTNSTCGKWSSTPVPPGRPSISPCHRHSLQVLTPGKSARAFRNVP